jgi:hypothetical protein
MMSLEVDVTITDARSPRTANTGVPGAAAAAAEKHKNNKYKDRVEAAGGVFPHFLMEAHGRWSEAALNPLSFRH